MHITSKSGATPVAGDDHGAVVVHVHRHEQAPDELLEFPFGLEEAAARKLVRTGALKAARIGRRVYAKRSDVVGLVDKLAATPKVKRRASQVDPKAAYLELVRGGDR